MISLMPDIKRFRLGFMKPFFVLFQKVIFASISNAWFETRDQRYLVIFSVFSLVYLRVFVFKSKVMTTPILKQTL